MGERRDGTTNGLDKKRRDRRQQRDRAGEPVRVMIDGGH